MVQLLLFANCRMSEAKDADMVPVTAGPGQLCALTNNRGQLWAAGLKSIHVNMNQKSGPE